jgi:hypothetical protein
MKVRIERHDGREGPIHAVFADGVEVGWVTRLADGVYANSPGWVLRLRGVDEGPNSPDWPEGGHCKSGASLRTLAEVRAAVVAALEAVEVK